MNNLENFGAYRKANDMFTHVMNDMQKLRADFTLGRLVSQQLASADSIAANIEEGYGRGSTREYIQFLIYARGSAQETRGRYGRMRHWLTESIVEARQHDLDEILFEPGNGNR